MGMATGADSLGDAVESVLDRSSDLVQRGAGAAGDITDVTRERLGDVVQPRIEKAQDLFVRRSSGTAMITIAVVVAAVGVAGLVLLRRRSDDQERRA